MPEVVVVQQADEPGRRKGRPKGRRRRRGWRGRRGDGVPAKPRSSRGRGRCSDAEGGGGDVGRRTGNATVAPGGGTVAAKPLFCRRERVSGVFPAKRRADRGRGGGCEAEGEDGAAGRCSGEEGEAAGGGRRGGKRGATAGTRLRRSPRETEGRPGWRRRLRCCRRRRRGRPALRQGDGVFSSPDFSLVAPLADFEWIVALEDGTSVPELLIIHIFGVNLIQVTHFTLCVDISLSLLGYHACYHENIMLVIYF
uniref:Uncharacterized protein n=1 Tax=Oryza sativa subsp. japonica TaxID=39947 RepID=Q6Z0L7_ORYSJ|nr:hypothetical protein [Oryza sativa Japonica Group]